MNRIVLNFKDFILNEKNKEETNSLLQINEQESSNEFISLEEYIKHNLTEKLRKSVTADETLIKKIVDNSQYLIADASKVHTANDTSSIWQSAWSWIAVGVAIVGGAYAIKKGKLKGLGNIANKFKNWFKKKFVKVSDETPVQFRNAKGKFSGVGTKQVDLESGIVNVKIKVKDFENLDDKEISFKVKDFVAEELNINQIKDASPQLQKEVSIFAKYPKTFIGGTVTLSMIASNIGTITQSFSNMFPDEEDLRIMSAKVNNPDSSLQDYKFKLEQLSSFDEDLNISSEEEAKLKLGGNKVGYVVSYYIAKLMQRYDELLAAASVQKVIDYSLKEITNETQQG